MDEPQIKLEFTGLNLTFWKIFFSIFICFSHVQKLQNSRTPCICVSALVRNYSTFWENCTVWRIYISPQTVGNIVKIKQGTAGGWLRKIIEQQWDQSLIVPNLKNLPKTKFKIVGKLAGHVNAGAVEANKSRLVQLLGFFSQSQKK